jgi:hypothetical protein
VAVSPAPPGPRPRRPLWRSVLLSGLVFPGLGQLMSGHPVRGLVFATGSLVAIVVLVRRVARETLARLPTDPTQIDPLLPFRLAHDIHRDNADFFLWITLTLVALWAGSVVDAWVSSFNDPPPYPSPRRGRGGREVELARRASTPSVRRDA